MRRRKHEVEEADLMKTVVEVASVKAQAQAIIRRVKTALDELEETVNSIPGEREVIVDDEPA